MNLSKTQSITLGLGTIVVFFAATFFMLQANRQGSLLSNAHTEEDQIRGSLSQEDLNASVTLNSFHRSETRDGKKVWEVTAARGRYIPQENAATLEEAHLFFYKEDGSQVELEAKNARLILQGTALLSAEAFNGLTLLYDNKVRVVAERGTYDHLANTVFVPDEVTIIQERAEIKGRSMRANLESREFVIEEDVSTAIAPNVTAR